MRYFSVVLIVCLHSVLALPLQSEENDFEDQMHHYHHFTRRGISDPTFYVDEAETTSDYWIRNAQETIKKQLNKRQIEGRAKNVIMFLGDGMSIPTLIASRAYQGQLVGNSGEETSLSFEEFPFTGLSKTYCVDRQVADSACTATAYLCGVKANYGTIGVSGSVERNNCTQMQDDSNHVSSIGRWSQLANKATGVVTTTRITHASPSGMYAHTAERDWESDADVIHSKLNPNECQDIASQLIYGKTGRNFNVILGGGRRKFLPENVFDEEDEKGERKDGKNLIEQWLQIKKDNGYEAEYVWNKTQLLDVSPDTEYLLGLFESDHCMYHIDANPETEPTLAEMTEAAIKVLSKNDNGYFLFVEGGRIDHAHHDSKAHKALDETLQLSEAVKRARQITDIEDTLIVVTSDHAHTMSMAGYAKRGNDIFGIAGNSGIDHLPYSTLTYANGPGYKHPDLSGNRYDISQDDMDDENYKFPSTAPLSAETHGGDDVGIFASGPWAHLLTGVLEQNVIPHIMAFASCVGSGKTACDT